MLYETGKLIVVVDDATINITKAEYILKPKGYDVKGYTDPALFLYDLTHGEVIPDLLLLDIEMPKKDGISVLADIRSSEAYRNLPVFFVTGHVSPELVMKAGSLKVNGYIKKPFQGQELIDRVNMVLGED